MSRNGMQKFGQRNTDPKSHIKMVLYKTLLNALFSDKLHNHILECHFCAFVWFGIIKTINFKTST